MMYFFYEVLVIYNVQTTNLTFVEKNEIYSK